MADERSIFEIQVVGMAEFDGFLKKLTIAKNSLIDIASQYKAIEAQLKASNAGLTNEQIAYNARTLANDKAVIADRRALIKDAGLREINDIKAKNAELIGKEKALTEQVRRENLERTQSVKNFNGSLIETSGLLKAVAVGFGISTATDFVKKIFDAQSQVEALQLTLKNLLGEISGNKLFDAVQEFTTRTPFTFDQTIKGVNQLVGSMKAAGIASSQIATEVTKVMDSLGNSASALGGGDRFDRLTYAFTQVQAAGRLMGTEVRQIAETGFPLLAVMAQKSGETVSELRKRISDGQVGFKEFKEAILSAGEAGGVFSGSMKIMSDTVSGRFAILKDNVFFASARIVESVAGMAKFFVSATSNIVNFFFGTQSAANKTIEVIKTLGIAYLSYVSILKVATLAMAANTTATTANSAGLRILVLLKQLFTGQITRSTIALGLETQAKIAGGVAANTLSVAEQRAAASALLLQRALGVVVIALGAIYLAYQLLKEQDSELVSQSKEKIALLNLEKERFNSLAKAVLSKNLESSKELEILNKLKKEHPILLKGIDNLKDAEDKLRGANIKSNEVMEFRKAKLEQLKLQFPEQLKGINNLEDAERRLGKVIRDTNGDFAVRQKLMINEVAQSINNKVLTEQLAKQFELQAKIRKASNNNLVDIGGNTLTGTSEKSRLQAQLNESYAITKKGFVDQNTLYEQALKEKQKLKFKYDDGGIDAGLDSLGDPKKTKERLKKQTDEYIESATIENRRIIANQKIADAELESTKKSALKELFDVETESLRARYVNTKKFDSEYQKLKVNFYKDIAKLDDGLHDKLEKAEKELNKTKEEQLKIRHQLERDFANQNAIETLTEERDKNLALATSEQERLAILKEYSERIYQQNLEYIRLNFEARRKEITDELQNLETIKSANDLVARNKIENFRKANPFAPFLVEQYAGQINSERNIANAPIEGQIAINNNKLLAEQLKYNSESSKLTKAHAKDTEDITKKSGELIVNQDLANRRKLLVAAQSIYKSIRLLVISELDSTIASLEKVDGTAAKIQLGRFKALRDGAKGAFDGVKNVLDNIKFKVKIDGKDDKQSIIGSDFIKTLGKTFSEGGKIGGLDFSKGFLGGLSKTASKVAPILGGVIAAYKLFDAVMGAIEQNRLAKIKATQEAIIKANNKAIEQAKIDFEKLNKALDASFKKDNDLINKNADQQTINEINRYGKSLERLITNKTKVNDINKKFDDDSLRIRLLYAEGLESTDEATRLKTEAIVDKQIANLADKRNKALQDEIEYQAKRKEINERADQDILALADKNDVDLTANIQSIKNKRDHDLAEIGISEARKAEIIRDSNFAISELIRKSGETNGTEIDKINQKRNDDLNNLKGYSEQLYDINKTYDDLILEAKLNKQGLTEEALAMHLANLNGLRLKEIEDLNASEIGLSEAEAASAARRDAIEEERQAKLYARQLAYDAAKLAAEKAYRQKLYDLEKSNFEAQKVIQLAELKVERAKASRKLFGREKLLGAIDEAIAEIQGLAFPDFAFKKGIDDTSKVAKENIDGQGGFRAILHPKEQIMNEKQMDTMTKANGGIRPTRQDVIDSFVGFKKMEIEPLRFNPFVIDKIMNTNNLEKEVKDLRREMREFAKIVANKPTSQTTIDKGGLRTYVVGLNSRKEIRNNRFTN